MAKSRWSHHRYYPAILLTINMRLLSHAGVGVVLGGLFRSSRFSRAGGSTPESSLSDVAGAAGIHAEMRCGGPEKRWIPEANGSGAAWLDYDNDGLMDLLIVNGSSMEQLRRVVAGQPPAPSKSGVYLFHNLGNGKFEDVTERAGLSNAYWGTGANAADYNNDGYTDILITTIGVDLLYKNNGNGTFSEVGERGGLEPQRGMAHRQRVWRLRRRRLSGSVRSRLHGYSLDIAQ